MQTSQYATPLPGESKRTSPPVEDHSGGSAEGCVAKEVVNVEFANAPGTLVVVWEVQEFAVIVTALSEINPLATLIPCAKETGPLKATAPLNESDPLKIPLPFTSILLKVVNAVKLF